MKFTSSKNSINGIMNYILLLCSTLTLLASSPSFAFNSLNHRELSEAEIAIIELPPPVHLKHKAESDNIASVVKPQETQESALISSHSDDVEELTPKPFTITFPIAKGPNGQIQSIVIPLPSNLDDKTGIIVIEDHPHDSNADQRTLRAQFFSPSRISPLKSQPLKKINNKNKVENNSNKVNASSKAQPGHTQKVQPQKSSSQKRKIEKEDSPQSTTRTTVVFDDDFTTTTTATRTTTTFSPESVFRPKNIASQLRKKQHHSPSKKLMIINNKIKINHQTTQRATKRPTTTLEPTTTETSLVLNEETEKTITTVTTPATTITTRRLPIRLTESVNNVRQSSFANLRQSNARRNQVQNRVPTTRRPSPKVTTTRPTTTRLTTTKSTTTIQPNFLEVEELDYETISPITITKINSTRTLPTTTTTQTTTIATTLKPRKRLNSASNTRSNVTKPRPPGVPQIPGNFGFLLSGKAMNLPQNVPGRAGTDYPVYAKIPITNFDCREQVYPGFYSDMETGCQVYHSCVGKLRASKHTFLCPNGTIFSQEYLICDWWYNVKCEDSPKYYPLNKEAFSAEPKKVKAKVSAGTTTTNAKKRNKQTTTEFVMRTTTTTDLP